MAESYHRDNVIKNKWPDWIPAEQGVMERRWQIEFEAPLDGQEFASSGGLGESELEVLVTQGARSSELDVVTKTRGNAWSDELFFFAAYRLFERLEAKFGRIRTIQGQGREQWRPFRSD